MDSDEDREQGIEFGDLRDDLETLDFPVDAETVQNEFGDHELELADDTRSLGEALETVDDQSFESVDDVIQMVKNVVGSDAVGRESYSDRGPGVGTSDSDDESF